MQIKPFTGAVLYSGPSRINKKPIIAIMTFSSSNIKTGDIPQVWIMAEDMHPHAARLSGDDVRVCGGCIFGQGRGCYVQGMEIGSVYRSYKNNRYGDWDAVEWWFRRTKPRAVRLGAYGDPVAVPLAVWDKVAKINPDTKLIGYSQMWGSVKAKGYNRYCMASTKSIAEAQRAVKKGWRSFRVRTPEETEAIFPDEEVCGAQLSDTVTCETCLACTGGKGNSVSITVHGNAQRTLPKAIEALNKLRSK